jgi:hypothetical protein
MSYQEIARFTIGGRGIMQVIILVMFNGSGEAKKRWEVESYRCRRGEELVCCLNNNLNKLGRFGIMGYLNRRSETHDNRPPQEANYIIRRGA